MCGIAGIAFSKKNNSVFFEDMLSAIQHRGPDSHGIWHDENIILGHRRLSIIDLSPTGHQPMHSASGRYVITYNGEIYNFLSLKKELLKVGYKFEGTSDTEVLLACLEEYGIEQTLKKLNGMFALAVWDKKDKALYLARDRFGEKPLYYGYIDDIFIFASELKAIKKYPNWVPKIDQAALSLYLRYAYIPAPFSIYEGIKKLMPGSFLRVDLTHAQPEIKNYWSAVNNALNSLTHPLSLSDKEAIDLLEEKLTTAVRSRSIADVPLGAFLSGGVDSSTIVALMQKNSHLRVKTYTIGFSDTKYNEAVYAKKVAAHLKTDHTEVYLTEAEALNVVPLLPVMYDEPFADSSQIPTYLVSKIARSQVTVCLSGDAGDELFGGYNRYIFGTKIAKRVGYFPPFFLKGISKLLLTVPISRWDEIYYHLLKQNKVSGMGDKLHKLAELLPFSTNRVKLYEHIISWFHEPQNYLLNDRNLSSAFPTHTEHLDNMDYCSWMMLNDTIGYLPGDILTKVDRASMAVSLESRVPFLDPDIFDLMWRLPHDMKIRGNCTKWLLRQVLYRYVPKGLIERPKMGFGIPLDSWLRGELREWAEDLLNKDKMRMEGHFNVEAVHKLWREHLSHKRNFAHQLWIILMFQAWLRADR